MRLLQWLKNAWNEPKEPWMVHRPSQIFQRARQQLRFTLAPEELHRTSWGGNLWCYPKRSIGENIRYRGIFDIAVSELLARLLYPSSTLIDAGSNIGYMSILGAKIVGQNGHIIAFEPNPEILPLLKKNIEINKNDKKSGLIELHSSALGEKPGKAALYVSDDYVSNEGIARINARNTTDRTLGEVEVTNLDIEMAERKIDVLKIDVEGFELELLKGAKSLLGKKNINHIIFEDHDVRNSPVPKFLMNFGYNIHQVGYKLSGLDIEKLDATRTPRPDGAPSYLATTFTDARISELLTPRGWRVLKQLSAD
jgi:FkbM family methyltransferase